ncbi:RES family NAD+ phosphorylase [Sedimentibacter saalensis]|uniref:RES family NAD+ phosphorylase n=1 Tax=Sedimentibacter saalensis TaxID=130788 RepID=UPI0028A163A5|nr:RES family NAD+ phosphorylase [Sedimentibacter saalensis]
MYCCTNCFIDAEIKAIIESAKTTGDCNFCGKKHTAVYDIGSDTTLSDTFEALLESYTPITSLPDNFPKEKTDLLKNVLATQWRIFNVKPEIVYILITQICHEKYHETPELFDTPVGIWQNFDYDFLLENAIIKNHTWQEFVEAIKWGNRFHTDYINEEILNLFIRCVRKTYCAGTKFYRARICSSVTGYPQKEMGAPPKGTATAGRANPNGISMLYLADTIKTTLHEIRAGVYDYVTIGTFELLSDIEIINLADIDKISPFFAANLYGIDFIRQAVNLDSLKVISQEIAKPLRRHDSPLDYLPTQYISDFIKSKSYAGIEYISTMYPGGVNIAVFNESLLNCTETTVYDIKSLTYDFDEAK